MNHSYSLIDELSWYRYLIFNGLICPIYGCLIMRIPYTDTHEWLYFCYSWFDSVSIKNKLDVYAIAIYMVLRSLSWLISLPFQEPILPLFFTCHHLLPRLSLLPHLSLFSIIYTLITSSMKCINPQSEPSIFVTQTQTKKHRQIERDGEWCYSSEISDIIQKTGIIRTSLGREVPLRRSIPSWHQEGQRRR